MEGTGTRARALIVIAAAAVLIAIGGGAARAADEPSSLSGGPNVSGPPAPAVPAIAATPEPPAGQAVPNAPLEPGVAAREEPPAPRELGKPRSVKLWPFFEYESDPAAGSTHFRIFGPLLEYRADAERQSFAFRPLVSISQSRVGHDDDVSLLYPLVTSHWGQREQTTKGFGGLFTYTTHTSEDGRTLESQRALLLPVYAYQWHPGEKFGRFSAAPLYADVEDVFGYDRIEMAAFPAFVHVQDDGLDRRYYLFPLLSRDGPEGSGYRLWPFPLRDREGNRIEREADAASSTDPS